MLPTQLPPLAEPGSFPRYVVYFICIASLLFHADCCQWDYHLPGFITIDSVICANCKQHGVLLALPQHSKGARRSKLSTAQSIVIDQQKTLQLQKLPSHNSHHAQSMSRQVRIVPKLPFLQFECLQPLLPFNTASQSLCALRAYLQQCCAVLGILHFHLWAFFTLPLHNGSIVKGSSLAFKTSQTVTMGNSSMA